MKSQTTQMQEIWRELNALNTAHNSKKTDDSKNQLPELPSSAFNKMPQIQVVGMNSIPKTPMIDGPFSGKPLVAENKAQGCESDFELIDPHTDLSSTPPKFQSGPRGRSSSSTVDLPELPKHLFDDDSAESVTSSPKSSPEASQFGDHGFNVRKLRKKASRRISRVANELSEMVQNLSPRNKRSSPERSTAARKVSPKKDDPRLAGISTADRSWIAAEMAEFCLSDAYKDASKTRQSMMFNAKLIGLLEAYPDLINENALKSLRADLDWRMVNAHIDTVVNLQDERFATSVKDEIDARFIRTWGNEKAGEEGEKKYLNVKGKMTKTFLRDFPNTTHTLKCSDGKLETIDDPVKLMNFIGPGDEGDLPYKVSHVANQNLTTFLNAVLFRRRADTGEFDSTIKLWDGSPVTPKGNMRATTTYSKDSDGNIIVEHAYVCSKMTTQTNLGTSPANDSFNKKPAHDHAELKVSVRVTFTSDGAWEIENPHVWAKGWNVTAED